MKKFLSFLLCFSLLLSISTPLSAQAAEPELYSLQNETIVVHVSSQNGGFSIRTAEGDRLKKSDNNKELLYRNGEYDTSFTSFQVTRDGKTREYVFGGNYGFLGLNSSDVSVTQLQSSIVAVWSVDGIQFTQTIEVPNTASNQHGMVSISYRAEVQKGSPASIRSRILFDTALDHQDYGYYHVNDSTGAVQVYEQEIAIDRNENYFPESIYAADNNGPAAIAAYTVNPTAYRAVFAHWNNLAATVFDYTPDPSMTFTNSQNIKYATADSAYAIYNDLGTVGQDGQSFSCYYGVYSNYNVDMSKSVAFNVVAPSALTLTPDKQAYRSEGNARGQATFSVNLNVENISTSELPNVAIAAYTTPGITAMKMDGTPLEEPPTGSQPYSVPLKDLSAGKVENLTLQFKADVSDTASYRRVEFRAHDLTKGMQLSSANLIGTRSFYVLCPGGDGRLPQVSFTGADPQIMYHKGGNRFIITGTNLNLLENRANYSISLKSDDGLHQYDIRHEDIMIDEDAGTLTLYLPETYVPGTYHAYIKWAASAYDDNIVPQGTPLEYTSEALRLVFSEDEAYRNNFYGIAAVVQTVGQKYRIMSFKDEAELAAYKRDHSSEYTEFLLEFRGCFEATTDGFQDILCLTGKAGIGANEVITVNQCLDFQDGVVKIYYEGYDTSGVNLNSSNTVLVDFDGSLYTSGERTHIASVPAAFTAIEDGTEYDLLSYDLNGKRIEKSNVSYITLVWGDDGLQLLQSIAGSVFHLSFGIMGQFLDSEERVVGKTVSFTGGFDLLGILLPKSFDFKDGVHGGALDRIKNAFSSIDMNTSSPTYLRHNTLRSRADSLFGPNNDLSEDQLYKNQQGAADVQILVQDVLFAFVPAQGPNGQEFCGYYGFHLDTDATLPSYSASMPKIHAHININTIRNYNFAVDGSLKFGDLEFGVELEVLSTDDQIPILNKIFIFCNIPSGPGLMVDPAGTVRITGGGGGLNNIYDTVICTDKLPTVQILLRLYLKVVEVMSCQADAMFSLQGISVSMSNMRLAKLPQTVPPVVPYAGLKLQWLPSWYFHLALTVDLFQVVQGGGYIVVDERAENDVFFEAFLRAAVRIPDYVGLVGGVEVGGANLGFNSDRVWGAIQAIGITVGLMYYWGEADSFDFGANVGGAEPTYPELLPGLLGLEPVLLGYDEKAGENLYMRVGTNLSLSASATLVDDPEIMPVLMGAASVNSQRDRLKHKITTGSASDEIITLIYPADSYDHARSLFEQMKGLPKGLKLYQRGADAAVNSDANANLTFDPETGKATLAMTCKKGSSREFIIDTPVAADVTLLAAAPIPQIDSIRVSQGEDGLQIHYSGNQLEQLDTVTFYLTETQEPIGDRTSETGQAGVLLETYCDREDIVSGKVSCAIPAGLPSGRYYVRAVYSQEGVVNDYAVTENTLTYRNDQQPEPPKVTQAVNAGDLHLAAVLDSLPDSVDGYLVTVYDEAGQPTDFADVEIPKDEIRDNRLVTGGSYSIPTIQTDENGDPVLDDQGKPIEDGAKLAALTAGSRYTMGVQAFRDIQDHQTGQCYRLLSAQTRTEAVTVAAPTKADVHIASSMPDTRYSDGDVTFTVSSNEPLTGVWSIANGYHEKREGYYGTFDHADALTVPLTDLPDNEYVFELWGRDATGDSFYEKYAFTVDTTEPRLMISAPIHGSTFAEDGTLVITGITDPGTIFTVVSDGVTVMDRQPLTQKMDANGCFTMPVRLDQSISSHIVTITAADEAGNSVSHTAKVNHAGLSRVEQLYIYLDDVLYSDGNINTRDGDVSGQLSLAAATEGGNRFQLARDLVKWEVHPVYGSARIEEDGTAVFAQGSEGYLVGMLQVTDTAAMTAAAAFGTLGTTPEHTVSVGSTVGGTTIGGGVYAPGQMVSLTAVPDDGYSFSHWILEGASVSDPGQPSIQFAMPDGSVTAAAYFQSSSPKPEKPDETDTILVTVPGGTEKPVALPVTPVVADSRLRIQIDTDNQKPAHVTVPVKNVTSGDVVVIVSPDGTEQIIRNTKQTEAGLTVTIPHGTTIRVLHNPKDFTDAKAHWAADAIDFVTSRLLYIGTSSSSFGPDLGMTRAMLAQVLYNLEGGPKANRSTVFTDVSAESWYFDSVCWAYEAGVVVGVSPTEYAPELLLTREQLAVMLYRYAGSPKHSGTKLEFGDADLVSDYARDAMIWAVESGVIIGIGNKMLSPQGTATRAQVAVMLIRFINQ